MKKHFLITAVIASAALISACNSGYTRRNPGKAYGPDMTYSRAYDAYTENPVTRNGQTSQLPVEGTIARGQALPHHLTIADSLAYRSVTHAYAFGEKDIEEGKRLYNIYCGICHGTGLDGQGPLFTSGKFAAMPANLKDPKFLAYSGGQLYYTIMYGKGVMGSYASQLDDKQRWQVVDYIRKTIGSDKATVAATAAVDSSANAAGNSGSSEAATANADVKKK